MLNQKILNINVCFTEWSIKNLRRFDWRVQKSLWERESKNGKSDSWKQKYHPENFIALDYQPVKLKTESLSDEYRSGIKQVT